MNLIQQKTMEEFGPWVDSFGLVHPTYLPKPCHSQNGVRWTTEALLIMAAHGPMTPMLRGWYLSAVSPCFRRPGLLSRCITRVNDQDSIDNLCAAIAGLIVCEHDDHLIDLYLHGLQETRVDALDWSKPLLKLPPGQKKWALKVLGWLGPVRLRWVYNNTERPPTAEAWLGRFPALIAALKMSLFQKRGVFHTIAFWGAFIQGAFGSDHKKKQDGAALTYFFYVIAIKRGNRFDRWFAGLFKRVIIWRGDLPSFYRTYFKPKDYPTVKWFKWLE